MIILIGVNHKTAPAQWRGKVSVANDAMIDALKFCHQNLGSCFILSTCNRTEIIVEGINDTKLIYQWWADMRGILVEDLVKNSYCYQDEKAIMHLMQVASGLDAVVLGEKEVFGQLKKAYRYAQEAKTLNPLLSKSLDFVIRTAKYVRTVTEIDTKSISIPYSVMKLVSQIYSDFSDKKALLIGRGEVIQSSVKYFEDQNIGEIILANRNVEKLESINPNSLYDTYGLDEIGQVARNVDIIISATGSEGYLLSEQDISRIMTKKNILFIADLSMPLDIDPKSSKIKNLYLYTMDDLQGVVLEGREDRQKAAKLAQHLIESSLVQWQMIAMRLDFSQYAEAIEKHREFTVNQAMKKIEAGEDNAKIMRYMSYELTHKILQDIVLPLAESKKL